jgi:hypothetical protein
MTYRWHRFIEDLSPEHPGVIIDAVQRYLQFDTYAGVIPHEAIDTLFEDERLDNIAQQAVHFYNTHKETLQPLPQNVREETVRAHLAGIINLPVPSTDLWHDSFRKLHETNRDYYDKLSTAGRVEMLLQKGACADVVAAAVSKFHADTAPEYTPTQLIETVRQAVEFYRSKQDRLKRYSTKEQRAIISAFLAGKSDIAW